MEILEKLMHIQNELKAPKTRYNKFGEFYYRSEEDILDAVKPLLFKNNLVLTLVDEIVYIGDRHYVKANATITDIETNKVISLSAFAREPDNKPKLDSSQVTGSASTYARKYALNGLFLLDDSKDPDSESPTEKETQPKVRKSMTSLAPNPEPRPTFTFDDVKEQPKSSAFLTYKNNIEKTTTEGSLNLFLSSIPINPNFNDSEKKELLTIINKKLGKE